MIDVFLELAAKDETELCKKAFEIQKLMPTKNDWVLQLQKDLDECRITLPEESIKKMKKEAFKNLVKKQIKINYLGIFDEFASKTL